MQGGYPIALVSMVTVLWETQLVLQARVFFFSAHFAEDKDDKCFFLYELKVCAKRIKVNIPGQNLMKQIIINFIR